MARSAPGHGGDRLSSPVTWNQLGAEGRLERVAIRVRSCPACDLALTRTNAVPGVGPATARIMLVGEAPGAQEDLKGEPFVGPAGRMLDSCLAGIGLSRAEVFITNVVKCRPPGNRDPQEAEVTACSRYLDAQLDVIDPEVIVILGRHALARLLPDAGPISRVHGVPIVRGNRTYVPVYHPAAALHNPNLAGDLRSDFESVRQILEIEPVNPAGLAPLAPSEAGSGQMSLI